MLRPPAWARVVDRGLKAALDYVARWLEFQMRGSKQPGCLIAVVHDGKVVFEQAFGSPIWTGASP
jgi:hypothetical protein